MCARDCRRGDRSLSGNGGCPIVSGGRKRDRGNREHSRDVGCSREFGGWGTELAGAGGVVMEGL